MQVHDQHHMISTNLLLDLLTITGNLVSPLEAAAQEAWKVLLKELLPQRTRIAFPGLAWRGGVQWDLEVGQKGDFEEVLEKLNLLTLEQG